MNQRRRKQVKTEATVSVSYSWSLSDGVSREGHGHYHQSILGWHELDFLPGLLVPSRREQELQMGCSGKKGENLAARQSGASCLTLNLSCPQLGAFVQNKKHIA